MYRKVLFFFLNCWVIFHYMVAAYLVYPVEHLTWFQFLAFKNKATINIWIWVFEYSFSFLLDTDLGVKLVDYLKCIFNFIDDYQAIFQSGLLFCISLSNLWEFYCFAPLPTFGIIGLFSFSDFTKLVVVSLCCELSEIFFYDIF